MSTEQKHVLSGDILLRAAGQEARVSSEGLVALAGAAEHEIEAVEDSAFLVTIAGSAEALALLHERKAKRSPSR